MTTSTTRTLFLGACLAGALALCAHAQDLTRTAPPQSVPVVIHNATIHPVSGPTIENAFVLFVDGEIRQVARDGEALDLRERIMPIHVDAQGMHLYPGIIAAGVTTGLIEINAVRATVDTREVGAITPEVRANVAVNPDTTHFPVGRANGVLAYGVFPQGGSIPGRASVMSPEGWTWEDMTILENAGLIINWPNVRPVTAWWMDQSDEEQMRTARRNLAVIEDAFANAEAYFAARAADPTVPESIRWESMRPAIERETPVFINAQELEQIQSAVSWAAKRNLRTVIVGGRDAHLCADLLKRHDVGVMLTGTHRLPRRADAPFDEPYRLAEMLEDAGVRWCMGAGASSGRGNERNLPYEAATAVAHGLDRDLAVRSITLSVAEFLGVDDMLGSIEPGKRATFFLSDGDPLDVRSRVHLAFVDGRLIDLSNKQTELADKYREKYRQLGLIDEEPQRWIEFEDAAPLRR
ncbi:MAG: imidazolonepropionase [Phycisphaerales bacterium]|nr:MAG: imidazolonepropionase [Phycisphaerales bacterium]